MANVCLQDAPALPELINQGEEGPKLEAQKLSTVLEQDHFCSAFLCSHEAVLTNSQNHEDELSWRRTGKGRPGGASALSAVLMNVSHFPPQGAE